MRSDKPTDIFCEMKKIPKQGLKFPHLVTKNMRAVSERPRLGLKNVCYPNRGQYQISGKNENQSISVINNFLSRSFKKNLNGKKLDFYILKELDQ